MAHNSNKKKPKDPSEVIDLTSSSEIYHEYEIEKVIGTRINKEGKTEYLVKWLGHGEELNCWIMERRVPWNFRNEFSEKMFGEFYELFLLLDV